MTAWIGDIIVSVRHLAKAPGFTLAAVVVLALGIGLNAAMFGLIYALGFTGRPFAEPDRVMQLYSSRTNQRDSYRAFSYPAYRQLAEGPAFSGILAHSPAIVGVGGSGDTRRTFAALVSRNYFDVLGVPIIRGRGFTAEEDRPGQDIPVAVASYAFWQQSDFDADLVGSVIRVNERAFTIVGIAPRGFTGTMVAFGADLFFPLGVFHSLSNDFDGDATRRLEVASTYSLFVVGRLADAVSKEMAAEALALAGPQLAEAFPAEYADARVTVAPLPRFGTSTSPSDESVLTLLSAVMLGLTAAVLLTVCLNLAAMLLARGRARRKEFAIRLALGASRVGVVRQLLTEGLLLALAGGAAGVLLGNYAIDALVAVFRAALPISIVLDRSMSPALVIATLGFCVLATLSFALGPALRHSRPQILPDLKPQAGEDLATGRARFMPRHPLLVAQVSLSLALLIAAGLFVRMAQTALSADFGFHADETVLAEVDSRLGGYSTVQSLNLFALVEARLAAIPGVESVSIGALVPMGLVNISESVRRAGINLPAGATPATADEGRAFDVPWNAVSGAYFSTMGVPLLRGRTFSAAESFVEGTRRVVVVDDALARRLWPDEDALGQFVEIVKNDPAGTAVSMEVVGIVGSTRRQLFEKDLPGSVYVPFAQGARSNASFHVRPSPGHTDLTSAVRQEIRSAAPNLPLFGAQTFASHMANALEYWLLRLTAVLFAAFGGFAMLVALIGIYGALSYAVARRTREIGIRMAVGASAEGVTRMIVGEGLTLTLLGVALGLLLGVGVGQLLGSIFVDVSQFDILVFTVVPLSFVSAALLASWLPARRATRVNPLTALRAD